MKDILFQKRVIIIDELMNEHNANIGMETLVQIPAQIQMMGMPLKW